MFAMKDSVLSQPLITIMLLIKWDNPDMKI